jgi:hypothetical protein
MHMRTRKLALGVLVALLPTSRPQGSEDVSTPAVADIVRWLRQRAAELVGVAAEVIRDDEMEQGR